MNTISNIGSQMAMEGLYRNSSSINNAAAKPVMPAKQLIADASVVVDKMVQDNAQLKADAAQLQKLSDMVMGTKLQFNVNEELGTIVVRVVDPSTNQVVKEIPSADVQRIKVNIRKAIGVLFDEVV